MKQPLTFIVIILSELNTLTRCCRCCEYLNAFTLVEIEPKKEVSKSDSSTSSSETWVSTCHIMLNKYSHSTSKVSGLSGSLTVQLKI